MLPGLTVHMCQKQINAFSKPIQNLFFTELHNTWFP